MAIKRTMNAREWAMLVTLGALWGGSFLFVAVAVRELPTITIVVVRVSLAAAALHVILAALGIRLPTDRRAWVAFVLMSLVNNIGPFLLIVWGQRLIASGVASILNATTPFITLVLAHFATADEKMSAGRLTGVVIGILGVAVLIGGSLGSLSGDLAGEIAILVAALCYSISSIFARRFSAMGIQPLASATGLLTVSTIILTPLMLAIDQPWTLPPPSNGALLAMLGLALPSTAFAYLLYFRILAAAGATNLALVTFLMPVSAIILGVTVLGERIEPRHLVGMALITLGLAAIDGRAWRWLRARRVAAAD